jgi:hypothetical protein
MKKRQLLCAILLAFGLSACNENETESPATLSNKENPVARIESGNIEDESLEGVGISSSGKTLITQTEFDQIIANTPEGQPVVIQNRFGSVSIGDLYVPGYHPDLLTFNFIDCDFENIVVQNTMQAVMTLNRCTVDVVVLTTGGVVYDMTVTRSIIGELRTIDGSQCDGLYVTKSKISQIMNDSGGDSKCFRVINFQ